MSLGTNESLHGPWLELPEATINVHPYEVTPDEGRMLLAPARWQGEVVQEDGLSEMLTYLACWSALWVGLFYFLSSTLGRWTATWPASSKAHENDHYWCARNVLGIIHAVFISLLTVPAFFFLFLTPDDSRFGATGHLATCSPQADRTYSVDYMIMCQAVALAGLAFTAFTLADVGISFLHGLASVDFVVHHLAFITAGLIIRSHCMLPFNASVLLSMEASTPFLNYLLLVRHRGDQFKSSVQVTGILFMVLFVIFRLIINTYGAVVLWMHHDAAMPPTVPRWQAQFLLMAVAVGCAVQFFWFPFIVKTFGAGLRELLGYDDGDCKGSASGGGAASPQSSEASSESRRSSAVE